MPPLEALAPLEVPEALDPEVVPEDPLTPVPLELAEAVDADGPLELELLPEEPPVDAPVLVRVVVVDSPVSAARHADTARSSRRAAGRRSMATVGLSPVPTRARTESFGPVRAYVQRRAAQVVTVLTAHESTTPHARSTTTTMPGQSRTSA